MKVKITSVYGKINAITENRTLPAGYIHFIENPHVSCDDVQILKLYEYLPDDNVLPLTLCAQNISDRAFGILTRIT